MRFDFTVIVTLQPSHCSFYFVFGCEVYFLVSSSVFLSMTVQQLVVIPVLLKEGLSAHPSTPLSSMLFWLLSLCSIVWCLEGLCLQLCSFFLKFALAILGLLWFHICFKIICSISVKNVMGIFNEDYIKSVHCLGWYGSVVTILILPIQEHRISFHFFVPFSNSFTNVL